MEPIFLLNGVRKIYAERVVVDLESLEVRAGEILVMVGPSGAGKSTVLRLMNFLEAPDEGQIVYRGQSSSSGLALGLRREVTTVFQRPALLHASVEQNVAYGLRLRGVKDAHQKAMQALEMMGLAHLRKAGARTLSGGEAQRVALARALVLEPQVLLLDEPTANLDPYNISLIEQVVQQINQQRKTTVVLVTHNIFQARRMAQRVGLMLNGRLVELADAHAFFENPRDARTKAFVNGEMVY